MSDPRQPDAAKAPTPKTTTAAPQADVTNSDAGQADVQAQVDADQEKGFHGIEVDPTPNENYTVAGVIANAPTPETDAGAKKAAEENAERVRKTFETGEGNE